MDRQWARTKLADFAETADRYVDLLKDYGPIDGDTRVQTTRLWRAEPTIRRILAALDASLSVNEEKLAPQLDLSQEHGAAAAVLLMHRAIGFVENQDEWAIRLSPEAPNLRADQFHPWVWGPAGTFWDSDHYRAAVDAAARAINAHTQKKIDRLDIHDDDLMNQAFTDKPKAGQKYLRLPGDPNDKTLKSRNNALGPFARGCIAGIRNPAAHEHGADWNEHDALEKLAALSILARWIDECEVLVGT
ncbi:TIGR02391 family protein [Mycobacteroides abscessus]|uniref:TIGR02391 family protein n=1 Tax=Mycobacteroides abscessus TaxID=36809 RepID=UPI0009A586C6|nr:TIGR02391 family protein [Mycobacteroides abscessus]